MRSVNDAIFSNELASLLAALANDRLRAVTLAFLCTRDSRPWPTDNYITNTLSSLHIRGLRKFEQRDCSLRSGAVCPRGQRVSDSNHVFATPQSMTSAARLSSDCGTESPSAAAVFKLTTSPNFLGSSTDKSAGRAPLSILST